MITRPTRLPAVLLTLLLAACNSSNSITFSTSKDEEKPTPEQAAAFVADAERQLADIGQEAERMAWVYANFITSDTEKLSAAANERFTAKQVELAAAAARFNDVQGLDTDTRRKLDMLRSGIVMPAPQDQAKTAEQAEIGAKMSGMYGKGKYCYANGDCLELEQLSEIMAKSRDPALLLETWNGWRRVSPPMKSL
ncbi:MAG: M2 family metallopeptidase, partial [Lysobacterales bacterium]